MLNVPTTVGEKYEKKGKVKRGWVAVRVGLEDGNKAGAGGGGFERYVIPIEDLSHPLFKELLEKAEEVYGCHSSGLLRLPCSVDEFLGIRYRIEQEAYTSQIYHHQPQLKYLA